MNIGKITIETSPTSKCTCTTCGQLLVKGSVRVVRVVGSGKWAKTLRYCKACGFPVLLNISNEFNKLIGELQ